MANKQSAKKEMRKAARRRVFNVRRSRAMKSAVKNFLSFIAQGKQDEAKSMIPTLYKAIDKAAKRGVIKKNTAARKKSRLVHALQRDN